MNIGVVSKSKRNRQLERRITLLFQTPQPSSRRSEGWLDGADEIEGLALGCELGTSVDVGLWLGWLDGAAEMDGFLEGMEDGQPETLGDSDGMDVGTSVLVGLALGWLDG